MAISVKFKYQEEKFEFYMEESKPLLSNQIISRRNWKTYQEDESVANALALLNHIKEDELEKSDQKKSKTNIKETNTSIFIPQRYLVNLSQAKREILNLPSAPPFTIRLQRRHLITDSDFSLFVRWINKNGVPQAVELNGVMAEAGGSKYLLSQAQFILIEEVNNLEATNDIAENLKRVSEFLSIKNQLNMNVELDDHFKSINISHASGFTLDIENNGIDFEPRLINKIQEQKIEDSVDEHLQIEEDVDSLPQLKHQEFLDYFHGENNLQTTFPISSGGGDSWYLVTDGPVLESLKVIKKVQNSDNVTKKEFLKNPRGYLLREIDESEELEEVIESIFYEPDYYAERVIDVGIYEKPILPWIKQGAHTWIPEKAGCGIKVGDKFLNIEPDKLEEEYKRVEKALEEGRPTIDIEGEKVPVSPSLLTAIGSLIVESPDGGGEGGIKPQKTQQILILEENYQEVSYQRVYSPRTQFTLSTPSHLQTSLMPHQKTGFEWLATSWFSGRPGVLLADDMGLGKTLLSLAFMAFIKEKNNASKMLVVAPTALLKNWEDEINMHFNQNALGSTLSLYGNQISNFKNKNVNEVAVGQSILDLDRLKGFDLILTTYETVRNYQHSLCRLKFDISVYDEAQKIKTPGITLTQAAKAVNSDFSIAVTGTPVENRMSDLWSIMDLVNPGFLDNLKSFSQKYEKGENPPLRELYGKLTSEEEEVPPIMLRRMKDDYLKGLPKKTVVKKDLDMPPMQADTYENFINNAYSGAPGAKLRALQNLRGCSLHPSKNSPINDEFIDLSARFQLTFKILEDIKAKNEKALVFIEDRDIQSSFSQLATQKFNLMSPPMLINGAVAGPIRQKRVKEFNENRSEFDLMIVSPRAGGVGLNLTSANHVIHLSRWWNPAVEDQCSDRVYRIGQEKEVFIYIPMSKHPELKEQSFDFVLDGLLERKRSISRDVLMPSENRKDDTEKLFREVIGGGDQQVDERALLKMCDEAEPIEFENIILDIYKGQDYETRKTKRSWDGGSDGSAKRGRITTIFQCKHKQDTDNLVDESAVEQIIKAKKNYGYQEDSTRMIVVTNAKRFTQEAIDLASENEVQMIARSQLRDLPI